MKKSKFSIGRLLMWLLLVFILFLTLFPFYWVLRTALTSQSMIFEDTSALLPVGFTFDNFKRVLGFLSISESMAAGGSGQTLNFPLFLRNSTLFAVIVTAGQLTFSTMAAYAFARLKFPGRNLLFTLFIAALMVPDIVRLIPNFVFVRNLGLQNTFAGMAAPYFFMTPFAVFFLRQFFLGINREVEEAAMIDGANYFSIFWNVILPVSRPPIVTLGIIIFIQMWNEYLWPSVIGREEQVRVLTVALNAFRQQNPSGVPDWSGLMAGTFLAIIPVILLYLIVGRRVIDSIQFTGFK